MARYVAMEISEAIYGRRAVREYTSEHVTHDTLTRLIDAAIQAPSAVNRQPWIFSVVQDQDLLNRISQKSKAFMLETAIAGTDHFLSLLADPSFHIFYHAPALIVISAGTDDRWAVEDCSLAAQNLMLAAYGIGLGSCWIGFAEGYLQTDEGKSAIQLRSDGRPVAPIIVGYPKGLSPRVPRREPRVQWLSAAAR